MIVCPNCKTENRPGAKFCKSCSMRLSESQDDANHGRDELVISDSDLPDTIYDTQLGEVMNPPKQRNPATKPLDLSQGLPQRPTGTVLGGRFLLKQLIFSDESENRYLVSQADTMPVKNTSPGLFIRACPNPACQAIYAPSPENPEKYCIDCGTALGLNAPEMVLVETRHPPSEPIIAIIEKNLSHGGIRAPILTFQEQVNEALRYYLLLPQVAEIRGYPKPPQVVQWGSSLARALDYIHENGVTFDGNLTESNFGLAGERAVWVNFNHSVASSGVSYDDGNQEFRRKKDIQSLALQLFRWMTGKAQYQADAILPPDINRVFEHALVTPGYSSGVELALALEQAIQAIVSAVAIDHLVGRRTHVGMMRKLNEDSILAINLERDQQSNSRPMGVYVVADGMGGHAAGEVASGTIINSIAQKAFASLMPLHIQGSDQDHPAWLREAVQQANQTVYALRKSAGTDMGSTLVMAVIEGSQAYIAHVGDSRAYLINASGIQQLTVDHSLVERLVANKTITRKQARTHPQRNVIYRTIGDKEMVEVEISIYPLSVADCILLCSDGLSGMLEDREIEEIVRNSTSPQHACNLLIDKANAVGGEDNISAIIVQIIKV